MKRNSGNRLEMVGIGAIHQDEGLPVDEEQSNVGRNLSEWQTATRHTDHDAAELLGISERTFQRWRDGSCQYPKLLSLALSAEANVTGVAGESIKGHSPNVGRRLQEWQAEEQHTDHDAANLLGISERTFQRWRDGSCQYPKLLSVAMRVLQHRLTRKSAPGPNEAQPVSERPSDIETRIVDLMTSNELPPGQQISIKKLTEQFGISPTPIRETLLKLSADDIVRHQPGQGFFVPCYNEGQIGQLYDFLYILLSQSVVKIIEQQNVKESERCVEHFRTIGMIDDTRAWDDRYQTKTNCENMFSEIARLSGNTMLHRSMRLIIRQTSSLRLVEYSDKLRRNQIREDICFTGDPLARLDVSNARQSLSRSQRYKDTIIPIVYQEYAVQLYDLSTRR